MTVGSAESKQRWVSCAHRSRGGSVAWDFQTDPEFQEQLDWMREVVVEQIEPLDLIKHEMTREAWNRATAPIKAEVKARGLWAAHLDQELGGQGMGQLRLALMHEILGRTRSATILFGNQAPDSGNSELLAIGADDAQKDRWLWPLLAGDLTSSFSLTEPGVAGSDPTQIQTTATLDGDEYVINGHKWFASNASQADFVLVMAVTNPDAGPYERASMIVVERGTPGMNIVRDVGTLDHPWHREGDEHAGGHAEILFEDCRVPKEHLIGRPGEGFLLSQKRLSGGRIHHAMRWIGQSNRAFDMLCERAVSRDLHGRRLGDKQFIQDFVTESRTEIDAARLLTLHTAWHWDTYGPEKTRVQIAQVKYWGARVLYNVIDRAIQTHGALGYSTDLPLEAMYRLARNYRISDGADEVHKSFIARHVLKSYAPVDGYPSEHVPTRQAAARERFADFLHAATAND
jgi:acyl-CoA dehydrogenase